MTRFPLARPAARSALAGLAVALTTLSWTGAQAQAQEPAQDLIAVQVPMPMPAGMVGPGVNPNTFIVGHPASPSWKRTHSHAEHPAVQQRARDLLNAIDSNTFRVQPPAGVRWVLS